jgi:hypothetical protein
MNVVNKLKMLTAMAVLVVGSALLTGCDNTPRPLEGNWDAEASAYFNKHLPPLKNLPGKVYQFQMTLEEGGSQAHFINEVFVDGVLIQDVAATNFDRIPGTNTNMGYYAGVKIRWTDKEGYKVDTGRLPARSFYYDVIAKMIRGHYPVFYKDYL